MVTTGGPDQDVIACTNANSAAQEKSIRIISVAYAGDNGDLLQVLFVVQTHTHTETLKRARTIQHCLPLSYLRKYMAIRVTNIP